MAKNGEQNMRKILLAAAFSITATSLPTIETIFTIIVPQANKNIDDD